MAKSYPADAGIPTIRSRMPFDPSAGAKGSMTDSVAPIIAPQLEMSSPILHIYTKCSILLTVLFLLLSFRYINSFTYIRYNIL